MQTFEIRETVIQKAIKLYTLDKDIDTCQYVYCQINDMDNKRFQKVAKALSDPRRFDIFQTIASQEAGRICSGGVCETVSVAQATVSHHLKELTEADLIVSSSEGQFKYFSANQETMNEYIIELQNRLNLKAK